MPGPRPLVSIVTPFFNEESYLEECIRSVLGQSWTDFEYILVDNHSTDASGEIARDFARRDPRIRVVNPPHHVGQVANHNFGLSQISKDSTYCKIVQGDDWLFPGCLEALVSLAQRFPSAGLISGYTLLEEFVFLVGLHPNEPFLSGKEVARRFLRDGLYLTGSPTAHLIRSDLVRARQPFYSEAADPFSDTDACLWLFGRADFAFAHQVLTFTRRSNVSITTRRRAYLNPLLLVRYVNLLRHGPRFFAPDELRACVRSVRREYYRLLGDSFWRFLPRDFWNLQAHCLAAADSGVSPWRTTAAALRALGEIALNPIDSIQRVERRIRRGLQRVSGHATEVPTTVFDRYIRHEAQRGPPNSASCDD
jgi:glycosyltransferase involved in cell wall biosynthesis